MIDSIFSKVFSFLVVDQEKYLDSSLRNWCSYQPWTMV